MSKIKFQVRKAVIKKIKNTVALTARLTTRLTIPLAALVFVGFAQNTRAGVFDNLVDAANGALATYGREAVRANRADLSALDISSAIREALKVGANNVVVRFATEGYSDTAVRIELPRSWSKAQKISSRIGYSAAFDDLERKLNNAALAAAPATRDLINTMVDEIEFQDSRGVLNGHDVAATQYLRIHVGDRVASQLRPIIDDLLAQAGAVESSTKIVKRIGHLPMVRILKSDLADHVVEESLNGFFYYLAKEEQAIRLSPASRTTDLLRRVFG